MGIWLSPPEPPKEWETIFVGRTQQIGQYKARWCRVLRRVQDNGDGSRTVFWADTNRNPLATVHLPQDHSW